jgi:hypothetical protein
MTDPFAQVETAEETDSMSRASDSTPSLSATPDPVHGAAVNGGPRPANGNGGGHVAPATPSQAAPQATPQAVREFLAGKHVCPFCGTPNSVGTQPCPALHDG